MSYRAGLRTASVPDEVGGAQIPLLLMYPASAAEEAQQFGPYTIDAARNAAPVDGPLPLVLISHGTGSSQFVFRTLAQYLARHGWVVGIVEHPFNNRNDDSLAFTKANLVNRPRHLRCVADWIMDMSGLPVERSAYAAIGHSMGG
jgi:predicted dienelactone hydrolase